MTTLAAATAAVIAVSTQFAFTDSTPTIYSDYLNTQDALDIANFKQSKTIEPVPIIDSVLILDATKVKVCRLRVTVDCDYKGKAK